MSQLANASKGLSLAYSMQPIIKKASKKINHRNSIMLHPDNVLPYIYCNSPKTVLLALASTQKYALYKLKTNMQYNKKRPITKPILHLNLQLHLNRML